MGSFQQITTNIKPGTIRKETMDGIDYMVVPTVMITEGVHEGNNGPLLYPGRELAKFPGVWNHKPIVVNHPMLDGDPISACDKEVIERQSVGIIMNTRYDSKREKLRSESWLRESKLQIVNPGILSDIQKGKMIEVSTGLFTSNEKKNGTWLGDAYVAVARDHKPDHLALLTNGKKGACSIADGAGLLQLNESTKEIFASVEKAIDSVFTGNARVRDVYVDSVVYQKEGKFYKQNYAKKKNGVTLLGDPEEIRLQSAYWRLDGSLVGNASKSKKVPKEKETMNKKKVVDGLIANEKTHWEEEDREHLMSMNEDRLTKLSTPAKPAKKKLKELIEEEEEVTTNEDSSEFLDSIDVKTLAAGDTVETVVVNGKTKFKIVKAEKITDNSEIKEERLPKHVQNSLKRLASIEKAQKNRLIDKLVANVEDEDQQAAARKRLDKLDIEDLEELVPALATNEEEDEAEEPIYFGAYTGKPTHNAAGDNGYKPEPLPVKEMDFSAKK